MTKLPPDRSTVGTEARRCETRNLHTASVAECVGLINDADREVAVAVSNAKRAIVALLEAAAPRFAAGGRLVYLGAGTSGRLGVLDASEAPPTFQVASDRVVGLIAGGDRALRVSSEGLEDEANGAVPDLDVLQLRESDTVIGIAAGGTTPYVHGALLHCKTVPSPPLTALLSCSPIVKPPGCDHLIVVDTGPEVLTGSTRMKAGTATKMVLNTISTTLMIQDGRVFENLMVDLRATNDKLLDRAIRIVGEVTQLDRKHAFELLDRAERDVKAAIVMHHRHCNLNQARETLQRHGGLVHKALADA